MSSNTNEKKIFYGWWIVFSGFVIQCLNGLLLFHGFTIYFLPLQAEFGWNRATVATAVALTRAEGAILGPIQGWLIDKYGPRIITCIGVFLFGLGFILFSFVNSVLTYFLCFALIALGSSIGGFLSISATITNWFNKKRALAQGLFKTGMGIGGLLVPLLAIAITTYGWRAVAFASGIIIIVFNMPAAMSLRHKPEPFGYMPDGEIKADSTDNITAAYDDTNDLSAVQAMKTSSFWFIGLGHAFSLLVVGSVGIHFTPHVAQKLNYSLEKAGLMISVLMVFTIIGQTVGGYLGDKIDKRLFLVFTMLGHSSGLLVLTFATNDFHVVMFCLLHGLAWGSRGPSMQSLRADYFGRRSFATIMGFSSILNALAMAIAPISAGVLADHYGDYTNAFVSLAIMTGCGSLFFALLKPPKIKKTTV